MTPLQFITIWTPLQFIIIWIPLVFLLEIASTAIEKFWEKKGKKIGIVPQALLFCLWIVFILIIMFILPICYLIINFYLIITIVWL